MLYLGAMTDAVFEFLKDAPLASSASPEDFEFGHHEISETLLQMVVQSPSPFTIGLFAKWGAGKSTIVNALIIPLKKKRIPVVIFDVWKHDGDALRRTFIKTLVRQLEVYGDNFFPAYDMDPLIDKDVVQTPAEKPSFNWKKLKKYRWKIAFALVLLGIFDFSIYHIQRLHYFTSLLNAIVGVSLVGPPITIWIIQKSVEFFSSQTTIYGIDRFQDPVQFEVEFGKILDNLRSERVLIVFDNLDRVTQDKVAEVLSTIKTFLEPVDFKNSGKGVIFLIPCDAQAIKQHLSNVYKAPDGHMFDSDEFLRKFFNSILWLPDFISTELEAFARTSLEKTRVPLLNSQESAWLITKAFRDNPRQVIQFVNILLANYLLIRTREGEDGDFPTNFIETNIPQLTKFLILKQLFPEEMDSIAKRRLFDTRRITLNTFTSEGGTSATDEEVLTRRKRFIEFLSETADIPITNLGIFITLRRSEQEKRFPGFDQFVTYLEDQQIEEAKKYFLQFGDFSEPSRREAFEQAVRRTLEDKLHSYPLAKIIDGLLQVLEANELTLSIAAVMDISKTIVRKCSSEIHLVDPRLVNQILLSRASFYGSAIVDRWLELLNAYETNSSTSISREVALKLVEVFVTKRESLSVEQVKGFQAVLAHERIQGDWQIAEMLIAEESVQSKFLTPTYVKGQIEIMGILPEADVLVAGMRRVENVSDSIMNSVEPKFLLNRLTEIISEQGMFLGEMTDRLRFTEELRRLLSRFFNYLRLAPQADQDKFVIGFSEGYAKFPAAEENVRFLPILLSLSRFSAEGLRLPLTQAITALIASSTTAGFREIFDLLPDSDRAEFFVEGPIFDQIEAKAIADKSFREDFFKEFPQDAKSRFVTKFKGSHFALAIEFISGLDDSSDDLKLDFFHKLLANFEGANLPAKELILKFVGDFFELLPIEEVDLLANISTTALLGSEASIRDLGITCLSLVEGRLSDARVRQITKGIFDQLFGGSLTDGVRSAAVRAVFLGYGQLNEEEQKLFQQYIFEELIRKGSTTEQVDLGFGLVNELQVKFEDRRKNFEDIYQRISEIPLTDGVRSSLLMGLKSRRPEHSPKSSQEFWGLVDALDGDHSLS